MILYVSENCNMCNMIKRLMNGMDYQLKLVDDKDIDMLVSKGFRSLPVLNVDDIFFGPKDIPNFLNSYENCRSII